MVFVGNGRISNAVCVYGERTRFDGGKWYYKSTRPWIAADVPWGGGVGSTDRSRGLYPNRFRFEIENRVEHLRDPAKKKKERSAHLAHSFVP